jgi:hypothetical protein
MPSPLSALSSETEDFLTPRKSLWSSSFDNTHSNDSNLSSQHHDVDDESSSDTDASVPYSQPAIPSSDTDIIWSSPLVGTKEDIRQKKKQKRLRKQEQRRQEVQAATEVQKQIDLLEILQLLEKKKLRFGQLLEFVFNPTHNQGSIRWHQFFAQRDEVFRILDFWVCSENAQQARDTVEEWAVDYIANRVAREARLATKSKILQTRDIVLDQGIVESFSFANINQMLKVSTPIAMRIMEAFSTSWRAEKEHSERRKERTMMVCTVFKLILYMIQNYEIFRSPHQQHLHAWGSTAIATMSRRRW